MLVVPNDSGQSAGSTQSGVWQRCFATVRRQRRLSPHRNDNNVHDKTFRDGSFLKLAGKSINVFRLPGF